MLGYIIKYIYFSRHRPLKTHKVGLFFVFSLFSVTPSLVNDKVLNKWPGKRKNNGMYKGIKPLQDKTTTPQKPNTSLASILNFHVPQA